MNERTSPDRPPRLRFAPSPTGALHLGSAFVAIANAAFARASGGSLLLRIDDTDAARSRDKDTFDLLRLLRWLEVEWDEGPVYQHDRGDQYRVAFEQLLDAGDAYPCFCGHARLQELRTSQQRAGEPPRYDGRCRTLDAAQVQRSLAAGAPHVLRFAVPDRRDVSFDDLVRGHMVIPAGSFGDPVLARSDGSAGYLFASVVDDAAFGITHVIRGEDHLANTARQLLLFEALGCEAPPRFAHLPLLRDVDGSKLSKRAPLGTLDELVDEGFLPVTVRRYLAELLGQGDIDLLGVDEPADRFRFDRVPTGAPKVDRARLESLGREDMARLDVDALLQGSGIDATPRNEPVVRELAGSAPSRVALRGELRLVLDGPGAGDLPHVLRAVAPDDVALDAHDAALDVVVDVLRAEPGAGASGDEELDDAWADRFVSRCREGAAAHGMSVREVLRPLRIATTGTTGGPALELVLSAIGSREAMRRVQLARLIIDELHGGNGAPDG